MKRFVITEEELRDIEHELAAVRRREIPGNATHFAWELRSLEEDRFRTWVHEEIPK